MGACRKCLEGCHVGWKISPGSFTCRYLCYRSHESSLTEPFPGAASALHPCERRPDMRTRLKRSIAACAAAALANLFSGSIHAAPCSRDVNGRSAGQQDAKGASRTGGSASFPVQTDPRYEMIVEGCD